MIKRSYEPELMDLGPSYYSQEEYFDCIKKLGFIGKLLGGNRATRKAFSRLSPAPTSILDVGCGNGSNTLEIAKNYPNAQVIGIDISHDAIIQAQKFKDTYEQKHKYLLRNLSFQHRVSPELNEAGKSFDVVTATLLCHHLNDQELVQFLRSACAIARQAVIINDLDRHPIAYALFWLISPLFNNRLIRYDGLISIKRSFTRQDWVAYLNAAGIAPDKYTITWRWAFRWIIMIKA